MSSFFNPNFKNNNHSNSQRQPPTFKHVLHSISDIGQYQFSPKIQQYNFKSYSPLQLVKQTKQKPQIRVPSQISEKSQPQNSKKQIQQIQKFRRKVRLLQKQNEDLKKNQQNLFMRIHELEKKIHQLMNGQTEKKSQFNDYQMKSISKQNNEVEGKKNNRSKQNSLARGSSDLSRQKTFQTSPILLKQLLLQCNQSKQFQYSNKKLNKTKNSNQKSNSISNWQKDQFYQFRNTKDCFNPFFAHLSRQSQLRVKKSIIRQKQLVYKDDFIQIGCISKKIQDHQFQTNIIITNLLSQPIKNINLAYLHKNDIQLTKQIKSNNLDINKSTKDHTLYNVLNPADQIKEKITVLAHTIDFRCILINVEFADYRGKVHNVSQILPAAKHRLFEYLVFTPIPSSYLVAQKVILSDKKFFPNLQKIKSYYKNVHFTKDRNKNSQALIKISFLSKQFYVTFKFVGPDKMSIAVHHNIDQSQLAQKIMGQMVFLFQM